MKKFLRNLFSGYLFVLLLLLIEIIIIIFFKDLLNDMIERYVVSNDKAPEMVKSLSVLAYIFIRIVAFIFAFFIFFKIINRQESPDFKIPWIVGMLLLPFFTSVIFLIFGNHKVSRHDKKIMLASHKACEEYMKKEVHDPKELRNFLGTVNYLQSTTSLLPHKNNKVKYYPRGEEFFPALIEGLKQAKEFIFMEFFIIDEGTYWKEVKEILIKKAEDGVEVRLVYDDMGCSGNLALGTAKYLRKHGVKCYKFHPFRPILSSVYNNRDHRKIVIVDHQMAFTGGINLADEYGNLIERFGYWKDTMVKIEGSAISNLIITFLQNYDIASGQISDYEKYLKYEYPLFEEEGYVMPFGDGPGGIDDALIGEQTYINILNYAKEDIYISTPYLIPTYGLIDAMRSAALRGVEVNLILPGIPDKKMVYKVAQSYFRFLMDAGVHIYLYTPGFNHMKTMLADGKLAFVGTINFDYRSLVHHFECGTVLYRNPCLDDIKADFLEMLSVSKQVPADFKVKGFNRIRCSIIKIISPLL